MSSIWSTAHAVRIIAGRVTEGRRIHLVAEIRELERDSRRVDLSSATRAPLRHGAGIRREEARSGSGDLGTRSRQG